MLTWGLMILHGQLPVICRRQICSYCARALRLTAVEYHLITVLKLSRELQSPSPPLPTPTHLTFLQQVQNLKNRLGKRAKKLRLYLLLVMAGTLTRTVFFCRISATCTYNNSITAEPIDCRGRPKHHFRMDVQP